jgi:hypothetical protein
MNIILITSIIDTPNIPLSYCNIRSVFSKKERYEQTKKTIESVKKIPNSKIFLVECSDLNNEEKEYFENNVDIFINLFELNNENLIYNIHSKSKSLGEGTMTIYALNYLFENNINFKNFFKISGRYYLNDKFNYNIFDNEDVIIQCYNDNLFASTMLYKQPYFISKLWYNFLLNSNHLFSNYESYERVHGLFIIELKSNPDVKNIIDCKTLGVSGNISVCGGYVES